jgi:hypothetical protein
VVISEVIPTNIHHPNETAIPTTHNHKCASGPFAVELLVAFFAGDLSLTLPTADCSMIHDCRCEHPGTLLFARIT